MDKILAKRKEMIEQFLGSWFLLGGLISSDTYKRTMWSTNETLSRKFAAYHLTLRKGLPEPGANNQLIMAGHEWMLRQWFLRPLKRSDIELAIEWYTTGSAVDRFPVETFQYMLDTQVGEDIYLPIDIWGFPSGQTFLAGVPSMSFEGVGGIGSFLEPQSCRYFGPIIHATKGRLMYQATGGRAAEFGYRADSFESGSIAKLLSIYTGNAGNRVLTSCDVAEFMFPEYFQAIGTIGHEYVSAEQSFARGLDEAELIAMDTFVRNSETASLLCDLVDAESVGLENAIRIMKRYPEKIRVGVRVDSGDIAGQCIQYHQRMKLEGINGRTIVYEDEVNPEMVAEVGRRFMEATGEEPINLFPGAGGYYYRGFHRDTVSAAFKRSLTGDDPNMKFSNSPGKESFPGSIRVYGQDDSLVVSDASERIDGEALFGRLVRQGRIVNPEDMQFPMHAQRANDTWGRYKRVEVSPLISEWMERFRAMKVEAQQRALKEV